MVEGYVKIVTHHKNMYWIAWGLFFLTFVFWRLWGKIDSSEEKKETDGFHGFQYDRIDIALFGLLLFFAVSSIFAENRSIALFGIEEWYMGFFMYASFFVTLYLYRHFWIYNELFLHLATIPLAIVSILGYLQRLGTNYVSANGFDFGLPRLSTIGNINWLCGYLSIMIPIQVFLFLKSQNDLKYVYGILIWIDFGFLAVQGSESGWLVLLSSMAFAYFYSYRRGRIAFLRFWYFAAIAFAGTWCGGYLYNSAVSDGKVAAYGGMSGIVGSNIWLIFLGGSIVLILIYSFWKKLGTKYACLVLWFCGIGVFLAILCGIGHSVWPEVFSFVPAYSILDFRLSWGSHRPRIWLLALKSFALAGWKNYLIGAGPDCFGEILYRYAASMYDWAPQYLTGNGYIANAHNEIINFLLNIGVLGVIFYYSVWIVIIRNILKSRDESFLSALAITIMFSSFIHNMVSFQQILSTPFLFLFTGMILSGVENRNICQKK